MKKSVNKNGQKRGRGEHPRSADGRQQDLVWLSERVREADWQTTDQLAAELSKLRGYDPPLTKWTIKADLKALREGWKEEQLENTDFERHMIVAQLKRCIGECWAGWHRSVAGNETQGKSEFGDLVDGAPGQKKNELSKRFHKWAKKTLGGDIRYISEIRALLVEIAKVRGLIPKEPLEFDAAGKAIGVAFVLETPKSGEKKLLTFKERTATPDEYYGNGAKGNGQLGDDAD